MTVPIVDCSPIGKGDMREEIENVATSVSVGLELDMHVNACQTDRGMAAMENGRISPIIIVLYN